MINDIKEYFRFNLYNDNRVLVNSLTDVIDEVSLFLDKKIYPYLKEHDERILINDIELVCEDEKIVWRITEQNEINDKPTLIIDKYNIKDMFIDVEYIKEIKETKTDYPKELCGFSLLSFMKTISYFIYNNNPVEDCLNVFDICVLAHNGINNVVYEMQ